MPHPTLMHSFCQTPPFDRILPTKPIPFSELMPIAHRIRPFSNWNFSADLFHKSLLWRFKLDSRSLPGKIADWLWLMEVMRSRTVFQDARDFVAYAVTARSVARRVVNPTHFWPLRESVKLKRAIIDLQLDFQFSIHPANDPSWRESEECRHEAINGLRGRFLVPDANEEDECNQFTELNTEGPCESAWSMRPIWIPAIENARKFPMGYVDCHYEFARLVVTKCWDALCLSGATDFPDRPNEKEIRERGIDWCLDRLIRWLNGKFSPPSLMLPSGWPQLSESDEERGSSKVDSPPVKPTNAPDFAWINCHLGKFTFTKKQRPLIRALWEDWEKGGCGVSDIALRKITGDVLQRVGDAFRNHPAWKTLIIDGERVGIKRLCLPKPGDN